MIKNTKARLEKVRRLQQQAHASPQSCYLHSKKTTNPNYKAADSEQSGE